MIKLIDLIELAGIPLRNTNFKIHCAYFGSSSPLDAFYAGKFKEWQANQNKKNFACKNILSLIHLGSDKWLFAGVYTITGSPEYRKWEENDTYYWRYPTQEVKGLEHLTGRAIVQFKKIFRASYLRDKRYADNLFVSELRPELVSIRDFPGYKSVLLSYNNLLTIVNRSNLSWKSALCNVAGVYLITDTSNGKLYIGSAYGGEGIWQRWVNYAENGHGGNKEIKNLLNEKGYFHANHFQFSIVEVCDVDSRPEDVIEKENHWKEVLQTRKFGLNKN